MLLQQAATSLSSQIFYPILQQTIDDVDIIEITIPDPDPGPIPDPDPGLEPEDIIEKEDSDMIGDEDMAKIEPGLYPDEPMYPPYRCDPYYEYCGGGDPYYHYDQYYYDKGAVHLMVWTSLWQCLAPFAVFSALEKFAYEENKNSSPDSEDHYTKEVKAWNTITSINTIVWGPMFALGVLSLSDLIPAGASLYIEHMISNLQIPAYLYSSYLMYEVAIFEGNWQSWVKLGSFLVVSTMTYGAQTGTGTEAQYFLMESPFYADRELYPSLFYILNWIEHEPRQHHDDYGYPPYHYDDYGNEIYYDY